MHLQAGVPKNLKVYLMYCNGNYLPPRNTPKKCHNPKQTYCKNTWFKYVCTYSFMPAFIRQIQIVLQLCIRLCARSRHYFSEQDRSGLLPSESVRLDFGNCINNHLQYCFQISQKRITHLHFNYLTLHLIHLLKYLVSTCCIFIRVYFGRVYFMQFLSKLVRFGLSHTLGCCFLGLDHPQGTVSLILVTGTWQILQKCLSKEF